MVAHAKSSGICAKDDLVQMRTVFKHKTLDCQKVSLAQQLTNALNCIAEIQTSQKKKLKTPNLFSRSQSSPNPSLSSESQTQSPPSQSLARQFLQFCGLEQYALLLEEQGFQTELDLRLLTQEDLSIIGIEDQTHRQIILSKLDAFLSSDSHQLERWLREHDLTPLLPALRSAGVGSLDQLADMQLGPVAFHRLGVRLLAHRKRLQCAVERYRAYRQSLLTPPRRRVSERAVAEGYWARPAGLKGATNDFLCVQGTLRAASHDGAAFQLEFMVDSGSDVVTCRQEVIDSLGLQLLGTIESRGVHSTVEKQLYRAHLTVGSGTSSIPVEVMPESYESLGNCVMKHFRHYITGDQHLWLDAAATATSPAQSPQ